MMLFWEDWHERRDDIPIKALDFIRIVYWVPHLGFLSSGVIRIYVTLSTFVTEWVV